MNLKPVKSSNVEAVGYDPVTNILSVQFKSGKKVYEYEGVPPELYDAMHKSESIGKYIGSMVVGKFNHKTKDLKETV